MWWRTYALMSQHRSTTTCWSSFVGLPIRTLVDRLAEIQKLRPLLTAKDEIPHLFEIAQCRNTGTPVSHPTHYTPNFPLEIGTNLTGTSSSKVNYLQSISAILAFANSSIQRLIQEWHHPKNVIISMVTDQLVYGQRMKKCNSYRWVLRCTARNNK